MTEDEFWELVASLNGQVEEAAFDQLTARLSAGAPADIVAFARRLDQVLRRLDLVALWSQQVWDTEDDPTDEPPPLDVSGFLDARAAVICAGRRRYEEVLDNPARFSGVWDFAAEMLLYVPVEAYEAATGEHWPYVLPGTERFVTASDVPTGSPNLPAPVSPAPPARTPETADEPAETTGHPHESDEFEPTEYEREYEPETEPADLVPDLWDATDGAAPRLRMEATAETYRLIEVVATYDSEPLEGVLAEPAPTAELAQPGVGEWPGWLMDEAFPAAATRITQVLRRHGGLAPLQVRQLWVVLALAVDWDLTLRLRPHSGVVHVQSDAVQTWDRRLATRAIIGLTAHVVLEVYRDYQIDHGALPDLERLRANAADLIPLH